MGRRALRTSFSDVELKSHWVDGETLPKPLAAREIFGRVAPLEIEVGTGRGHFLRTAAAENPDRDFLGIEIAKKYTLSTAAKLAAANLDNARIVRGDAQPIMQSIPDNVVSAVHIYFPDPWWKRRHRKRRVVNPLFIRDVYRVLEPAGQLHFWTDVREYFEVSLKLIRETTPLVGPHAVPEKPAAHDFDYRTHFERRMRRRDEPVYRSCFEKQPDPARTETQEVDAHAN
jgi:tRNA (guanine-N7-)-methyltransferase